MTNKIAAFQRAVDIVGGRQEMAKRMGVTIQAIGDFYRGGVTPGRAIQVHDITKGAVSLDELLR